MAMTSDRVTEFKLHFEKVLNPNGVNDLNNVYTDVVTPIQDDPITAIEVEHQILVKKPDKVC